MLPRVRAAWAVARASPISNKNIHSVQFYTLFRVERVSRL